MNYTVIHSDTEQNITREQAALLVELDWIEVMSMAGDEATYSVTIAGIPYAPDGDVDDLLQAAADYFPDVVAASARYALGLDSKPESDLTDDLLLCGCPKDVVIGDGAHQEGCSMSLHSINEVWATILSILPDAEILEDAEGQIVIYTGMEEISTEKMSGRFVKPQPAIGPTPEDHIRIMVLDDGETYSALQGCTIHEVPLEYDGDMTEEALSQVNSLTEDPDLAFIAQFDGHGMVV